MTKDLSVAWIRPEAVGDERRRLVMAEFTERKRWLFLGLPFTFTLYHVKENLLTIESGLLRKTENDCYMYKVQDVELVTSLMERLMGLGSVVCYTGDVTHPRLELTHIRNAKAIKDFILEASEQARMRRRTLNTLDIGAQELED